MLETKKIDFRGMKTSENILQEQNHKSLILQNQKYI